MGPDPVFLFVRGTPAKPYEPGLAERTVVVVGFDQDEAEPGMRILLEGI